MSDYNTTQRKVVNGKLQYVTGGSRVHSVSGEAPLSKVGAITAVEANLDVVPAFKNQKSWDRLREAGKLPEIPEGLKMYGDGDTETHYQRGGYWYPKTARVHQGDKIKIKSGDYAGCLALVKRVKNFTSYDVSAIIIKGSDKTKGAQVNVKVQLSGTEYDVVARRDEIQADDYLFTAVRTNLVSADES